MTRRRCVVLVLGALWVSGCGVPQIGLDRSAFQAVDALYTAVSLRDPKLLEACESNLNRLRTERKLPEAAGRTLDGFVAEARSGDWEAAQSRLADFMRRQRRAG
ncbi:MAG TPA: hypothetical protein VFT74_15010 [Isosphaeraceae bacterium]|nr:hypothetical protein [Isosphaeraceae bacterium]